MEKCLTKICGGGDAYSGPKSILYIVIYIEAQNFLYSVRKVRCKARLQTVLRIAFLL